MWAVMINCEFSLPRLLHCHYPSNRAAYKCIHYYIKYIIFMCTHVQCIWEYYIAVIKNLAQIIFKFGIKLALDIVSQYTKKITIEFGDSTSNYQTAKFSGYMVSPREMSYIIE